MAKNPVKLLNRPPSRELMTKNPRYIWHPNAFCPDCGRFRYLNSNDNKWVCTRCKLTKMCECRKFLISQPHECFYTLVRDLNAEALK